MDQEKALDVLPGYFGAIAAAVRVPGPANDRRPGLKYHSAGQKREGDQCLPYDATISDSQTHPSCDLSSDYMKRAVRDVFDTAVTHSEFDRSRDQGHPRLFF